jgi:hypothetical protein
MNEEIDKDDNDTDKVNCKRVSNTVLNDVSDRYNAFSVLNLDSDQIKNKLSQIKN